MPKPKRTTGDPVAGSSVANDPPVTAEKLAGPKQDKGSIPDALLARRLHAEVAPQETPHHWDPETGPSEEAVTLAKAMDEYKQINRHPFPTWSEVLAVAESLGYRKVAPPTLIIEDASRVISSSEDLRRLVDEVTPPLGESGESDPARIILAVLVRALQSDEDAGARAAAANAIRLMGRTDADVLYALRGAMGTRSTDLIVRLAAETAYKELTKDSTVAKTEKRLYEQESGLPQRDEDQLSPPSHRQPRDAKAACEDVFDDLVAMRQEHSDILVRRFEPVLNEYLRTQTPEAFKEKSELAQRVSNYLDQLGLAIRYAHQACDLMANQGVTNRLGRFLIKPKGSGKALISRANLDVLLPLELMPAPERREGLSEWRERVTRSRTPSSRRTK